MIKITKHDTECLFNQQWRAAYSGELGENVRERYCTERGVKLMRKSIARLEGLTFTGTESRRDIEIGVKDRICNSAGLGMFLLSIFARGLISWLVSSITDRIIQRFFIRSISVSADLTPEEKERIADQVMNAPLTAEGWASRASISDGADLL